MIERRLTSSAFSIDSSLFVQPSPQAKMGFWDGPLSFSTIGAWSTNDASHPHYVFANARDSIQTGSLSSWITWGGSNDRVEILFDSINAYSIGTILSGQVLLQPYQVLLVKRL
jgi:hypothetical protein